MPVVLITQTSPDAGIEKEASETYEIAVHPGVPVVTGYYTEDHAWHKGALQN